MPDMTEYQNMNADELVTAGLNALDEAQAAHYASMLGQATFNLNYREGVQTPLNGGQARVHADFKLGEAAALFTAALALSGEYEFEDDEDDDADGEAVEDTHDGPPAPPD